MANRKDNLTVMGFVIMEDASTVPVEDLTPEQREAWMKASCRRLSERLSAYFSQHPEEYAKF